MPNFTPPPLDSYQGPAQGFTPPPLDSYQGPAQKQEQPGFWSDAGHALWNRVSNVIPDTYHALTDRSEFAAMSRDPQFGADLADATKRKQFVGPPAQGQTMYGQKADSLPPEQVPGYGQIAGNLAGMGVNAGLLALATKAAPPVLRAVGRGFKGAAVPVAESALGVSAIQRGYGKTPGAAALEETSGIRPQTIAASAKQRIGLLLNELEAKATHAEANGAMTDIAPSRDFIASRKASAEAGNSTFTPGELSEMGDQLTKPGANFKGDTEYAPGANTPINVSVPPLASGAVNPFGKPVVTQAGPSPEPIISGMQPPTQALRMKREFGNDFTKWNPLHPQREMSTARGAYHLLDKGLDDSVPGAESINQRISSLIPIEQRAEQSGLNAGLTQNVLHRVGAKTGALAGAVGGAALGGPLGAAAGLLGPELAALPTSKMALARALYGTGKALGSTAAQRAAQATLISGGLLSIGDRKRGLLD